MVNLRDRDEPSRGMSRAVALQADVLSAGIVNTLPLGASNQEARFTANVYSSRRHAACRTASRIVTLAGAIALGPRYAPSEAQWTGCAPMAGTPGERMQ